MHDSHLCMVFGECDEGNLWTYLRLCSRQHTIVPESQVIRWFTQIALAIKYLHERPHPILHGDIKTQNIYLARKDKEGTCAKLLVEFGPMKVLENPTMQVRSHLGTHFCQCPEICRSLPYSTPADIWALGCILYEMCTAHMGWEAEDITEHMENIMIAPLYHIANHYSHELGSIATALLIHEADQRPSADALLKTPLLQVEMRKMLDGRHKAAAKESRQQGRCNRMPLHMEEDGYCEGAVRMEQANIGADAVIRMDQQNQRAGAYSARDAAYSARDGAYTARSHVRPLGEHNPRNIRAASPGVSEAAKLLLRPDSPAVRQRASSRVPDSPDVRSRGPSPSCVRSRRGSRSRAPSPGMVSRRSSCADGHEEVVKALAKLLLAAPNDFTECRR